MELGDGGRLRVCTALVSALLTAAPVSAAPDCAPDQIAGAYCADGSCRNFAVGADGVVRCMDQPVLPGVPAPPSLEFQIGLGAAGGQ